MEKNTFLYFLLTLMVVAVLYYVFRKPQPTTTAAAKPIIQPQPQPQTGQAGTQPPPQNGGGGVPIMQTQTVDKNKQLNKGTGNKAENTAIQTILVQKGYSLGIWGIDGDYGNATQKAHNDFLADASSSDRSIKFAENYQKQGETENPNNPTGGYDNTGQSFWDWLLGQSGTGTFTPSQYK